MSNYKILVKDYDALNPVENIYKQKGFFKKLINKYRSESCLDCSCGTGWHLSMLNGLGLMCYGSDLSPEMLTIAKKNLKSKKIKLKLADFRKLSKAWEQKFDMIICMTTSFPHMLTDRDAITALKSMYNQLNRKGLLVIDNGISDSMLNSKPKFISGRIYKNQAFYFFLEYPNQKQIIFNILQIKKTEKGFRHTYEIIPYNAMRKLVLQKYFARTKFRKINYFGDFNFSKYSRASRRLIVAAEK